MFKRSLIVAAVAALAFAPQAKAFDFEIIAGYFLPEELDEDLTYGVAFGNKGSENWGWQIRGMWFDVADSQGFSGQNVDADIVHVDFSFMWYPRGEGLSIFGGPGFASANIDVPTVTTDLSDDVFSFHAGVAYEAQISESFYIKPDFRLRWYELEGFGPDGGKQSQLNYEATVAAGWRF